jgi:alkylation response protein AidB-like acyl-CoA dehydrogenase
MANNTTIADSEAPSLDEVRVLEDALVERVKECVAAPDFLKRAQVADREGQLSQGNVRALQEVGATAMTVDPVFGAQGASLDAVVRVMDAIGYYDAPTAVALNMHLGAAQGMAAMPEFPRRDEALKAIRAREGLVCGAFSISSEGLDSRQSGVTARDEGDVYVLNGRTGFASMSDAATHTTIGGVVEGGDPDHPMYIITAGRLGEPGLINHGNWNAMGMRATGSNDIECKDLVIAKDDCFVGPWDKFRFRRPIDTAFATLGITAIWVGLARAAFDFTIDHVKHRYGYMAGSSLDVQNTSYRADEGWAQTAIGNMDHWLGTGQILLSDLVDRINTYDSDDIMGRDMVRVVFHLRRMAEEVALEAMKTCGAHGYVKSRDLERIFRDSVGGIVMAWKTGDMQQKLGIGALGHAIIIAGPGGN